MFTLISYMVCIIVLLFCIIVLAFLLYLKLFCNKEILILFCGSYYYKKQELFIF